MPYTMQIYPDEDIEPPELGSLFEVTGVEKATDMHWGSCIQVELKPWIQPMLSTTDEKQTALELMKNSPRHAEQLMKLVRELDTEVMALIERITQIEERWNRVLDEAATLAQHVRSAHYLITGENHWDQDNEG